MPNRKAKISRGLGIRGLQLVKAAHVAERKVMGRGGKQAWGGGEEEARSLFELF